MEWLDDYLYEFRNRAEERIFRMPRLVRDVTLRDFAKYNGDIHACLTGMQMENLGGMVAPIDKTTRKRKWIESQETEALKAETGRDSKSGVFMLCTSIFFVSDCRLARIMMATPKKAAPSTQSEKSRLALNKTPGTVCLAQYACSCIF